MNSDVDCPYCEQGVEICHDDGFGLSEDRKYEYECPHCEKNFVFTTSISVDHEAEKADCLNDGEHNYQITKHYPERCRKLRCTMCDDEKPLGDPACQ